MACDNAIGVPADGCAEPGYVFLAMNKLQKAPPGRGRVQQRHAWLAFPVAVWKKFGDDQAGNLAALIAYSALVAIFPLLLVLFTVLDIVLKNNPELQQKVLNAALDDYPVIGPHARGEHRPAEPDRDRARGRPGRDVHRGAGGGELAAERAQLGVGDPLRPPPRVPVVVAAQRRPDHRDRRWASSPPRSCPARGRRRTRPPRRRPVRAGHRGVAGAELRAVLAGLQARHRERDHLAAALARRGHQRGHLAGTAVRSAVTSSPISSPTPRRCTARSPSCSG